MVGSAAAVTALRRCYDVTTRVRCAGGLEPDVTLAEVAARVRVQAGCRRPAIAVGGTNGDRSEHFRAPEPKARQVPA